MPIDIASGNVFADFDDVSIPGRVPLVWRRRYSGTFLERGAGTLGLGWTHCYAATLTRFPGGFQFVTPSGGVELLPDPGRTVEAGGTVRHFGAFVEIFTRGGRYVVQTWDMEGRGDVRRYLFTPVEPGVPLRLERIENALGHGLDLVWDEEGRLDRVRQEAERRELEIGYDDAGLIDTLTLRSAAGNRELVARYEYDTLGLLVASYDAAGVADRFEYDVDHRLVREMFKDGAVFRYRYDSRGRCVLRTGLDRYDEKRLRYLEVSGITEVANSYGATSRFQALPSGQIASEWSALGAQRRTEYDAFGRIVARIDSTGATTRYAYDEQGNRAAVVDAVGQTTRLTFNADHLPETRIDAAGQVWRREFDAANRLVASVDPAGNRWQFTYDEDGNVVEVTNPLGHRKSQSFSGGVLRFITDWNGHRHTFAFDAFGRVIERRGPDGGVTRIRYDATGHPVAVTLPDASEMQASYDVAGNLIRYVGPNGRTISWQYGPCSRLAERVDSTGSIRFLWGTEPGRLQEVINAKGEHYRFFHNLGGQVVREVGFDGAERTFQYNGEDRITGFVNANGEALILERDALQRIVAQILPDGETVRFQFDALGQLSHAVSSDISVGFERDASGRITKETQGDRWIESRYDAVGRLVETATSLGASATYANDANGAVAAITSSGQTYRIERNAAGAEIARVLPGGLRLEQQYDRVGRLIEQQVGRGGGPGDDVLHRRFQYDAAGQLARLDDSRWGHVDYAYDPAERLIESIRSRGTSESFAYDSTGNIVHARFAGAQVVDQDRILDSGDRLVEQGNTRLEYDAEGRLVRKIERSESGQPQVWTYEWNVLDRLKSVSDPVGRTWRYHYDALARRVGKALVGGGATHDRTYLWDKERLFQESDGAGVPLSAWIYGDASFAPLVTVQHGRTFSIVNDQLGTPRELISAEGELALSRSYTAWGLIDAQFISPHHRVECPMAFQGQWRDAETGLHYNKFRYYSPESGRYISQDPIGRVGGLNFYSYGENPVNWLDPLGLCASHDSGQRGRDAAEQDITAAGHTILAEEVTMVVNGERVRADFVTQAPDGSIHVFEVKNGTGRLTDNQAASGVYDMSSPANSSTSPGGTIDTSQGTAGTMTVATSNPNKTPPPLPGKGGTQPATFNVLKYDV